MNDQELTRLLRALPRTNASPHFTSDVLRAVRAERPEERRPAFGWRAAAAFAMALCLFFAAQVTLTSHARRQRLESLRAQQTSIEADLEAVKKLAGGYEPVVVFEHNDGTRVVVDQTPRDDAAAVPAAFTID